MVFGLFARKSLPPAPPPADARPSGSSVLPPEPRRPDSHQLRTPSPSVDSASIGKLNSPDPREPPVTPSPPPDDPSALHTLILSIPPQTLHSYTLAHLSDPDQPPNPTTLASLSSFFSALVPPPRLHCVRCHKAFFDVENTDRSCLVPHDDDSAEVERVGTRGKELRTEYETLWGCCGKTVEGDGDMGPPDGWCYEGKHTTDLKRARFRADSTIQDDKLTSCERLRCHNPVPPSRSRPSRKRTRVGEDTFASSSEEDDAKVHKAKKARTRTKLAAATPSRVLKAEKEEEEESSDDMKVDSPPKTKPKSTPRTSKPKPKSTTTPVSNAQASSSSIPRSLSKAKMRDDSVLTPTTSPVAPPRPSSSIRGSPTVTYVGLKPKSSMSSLKKRESLISLREGESHALGTPSRLGRGKGKAVELRDVVATSVEGEV